MSGRKNTIVCSFDHRGLRLSAYEIHEWIGTAMALQEDEVLLVQVDSTKWQVYIRFREYTKMYDILQSSHGEATIRHSNGEIIKMRMGAGGLGIKHVCLANLPLKFRIVQLKTL
jgi:hypothetical protein